MKKIIMSMVAGLALAGVAAAEVNLNGNAMDVVTAGTSGLPTVGGNQVYNITFTSSITSLPSIKYNVAGAGATANAVGYHTLTDAKTSTLTVQGEGSSSAAGSLSVSAPSRCY